MVCKNHRKKKRTDDRKLKIYINPKVLLNVKNVIFTINYALCGNRTIKL